MQEKESKTNHHFRISLIKSMVRIFGGTILLLSNLDTNTKIIIFGVVFIASEVLGIIEEIF